MQTWNKMKTCVSYYESDYRNCIALRVLPLTLLISVPHFTHFISLETCSLSFSFSQTDDT